MYTYCEVKIPKSGKKLKEIEGITFFFRVSKRQIYVYETTTEVLVLVCAESKGIEFAEGFISRNLDRVRRFMNG